MEWWCTPFLDKFLNNLSIPQGHQLADRLSPESGRSSVHSNRHIPLEASRRNGVRNGRCPIGSGIAQKSSGTETNHFSLPTGGHNNLKTNK